MPKRKIDIEKMHSMLRAGKTKVEVARHFGVTEMAIYKQTKGIKYHSSRSLAMERSPRIIKQNLNAVEQLQKINDYANELLDLLMRWNRGDEEAIQILESQVRKVKFGQGKDAVEMTEFKFKDPRELAIKAMAEIRGQLALQIDIYKTMYDMKTVHDFQQAVLEIIREVDPGVRDAIIKRLRDRRAIRESVSIT